MHFFLSFMLNCTYNIYIYIYIYIYIFLSTRNKVLLLPLSLELKDSLIDVIVDDVKIKDKKNETIK